MYFLAFPTKTQAEVDASAKTRQTKSAQMTENVEQRSEYWM